MTIKPTPPINSPGFGLASVLLIIATGGILAAICATSLTGVGRVSLATGYLIEKDVQLDENCIRPVNRVEQTTIVM